MKNILLFGAGKSATVLIDYLVKETDANGWTLTVADGDLEMARAKLDTARNATAVGIDVGMEKDRHRLVDQADLVISLLPPTLHHLVAETCVELGKNLLTASYVDDRIKMLAPQIKDKHLLFLCEMGLDPGIDHMSAMELINRLKHQGGEILSFKSHTGGLVSPESDDNPWHYKISWNPRNVVLAGSAGAVYKTGGVVMHKTYPELFSFCEEVDVEEIGKLAWYPNRDSLSYLSVYRLEEAATFIRTTLRYPIFCTCWKPLVDAGLTDDQTVIEAGRLTYKQWSEKISCFVNDENRAQLEFIGLFADLPVPAAAKTNADVLQHLLEANLAMRAHDKDMIVMLHELEYRVAGKKKALRSSLVVHGKDSVRTAMAKTVGLPLGIAAVLILQGKINVTGLHIPILPEIYLPVMEELRNHQVFFKETISSLPH